MSSTTNNIVIIGAGISGLCMAINLIKINRRDFVILEKGAGIGGTWFDNTYPGCCCDVWSHLYSFSFHQNPCWTQLYPTQKEILTYLVSVAEHYSLYQHIRFNCETQSCSWSDERSTWNVNIKVHGGKDKEVRSEYNLECDFLISAVGQLNYPRYPSVAGIDDFEGRIMHSARWDWSYDYKGKRVAVVGSGATAAQIIPEVVESASHVTVFQRSPNWILDRNDALISPTVRSLYQYIPFLQKRTRASMMDEREQFHQLVTDGESPMAEQARTMTVRKLLEVFPHDEEMRRKLTPDFHPGCKRVILSDTYLPALSKPNCTLETKPITRITKGGIIVSDDKNTAEEAFDLIVFATGFRAVDHLHPLKITGAWGRSLDDIWKGGARALYGVTLEDMPNFGVLYGPNTNLAHNSLILQIESQAKYVATLADMVLSAKMKGRSLTIVPRRNVLEAYNEDLQRHLGQTSFADNRCESWFKDKTGLITTNWSGTAIEYQKMMSIVKWEDYELEGSGAFEARKKKEIKLNRVVEETLLSNRSLFLGASAALTVILWVVAPRGVSTWIN